MTIFTLTFALLLDACTAQIHATLPVTCFHCDNHARHFPACLNELVTCHPDEVCSILYGNGLPTLKCQKANDCARDVSHPTRLCTGGGVEVHPNQCELCCPTTECVQGINELLLLEFPRPVQQGPVHCFHCDNHARHYPACLSEPVTCHADEVCSFVYGNGLPLIGCEKAKDCALDVSRPMRNCAGGGVEVHPNQCELCCSTTACVQEMNGLLLQEFPNHGVICPGTCSERDIATCIQTAAYCHVDQFCAVGINEQLVVNGQCRAIHDIQKCRDDQAKHPCNLAVGQTGHIAKCVWDCCDTKECLNAHFGAYMGLITTRPTTMAPTTPLPTTSLPVTPAPTTPAPTTPVPTTPVPTTPAPTTPVPTAPSVTSTAATPDKPLTCAKCDGACKDNEIEVTCPDGFCSLTVDDSSGGNRVIKKGCSDLNKCRIFWTEWNSDPICHRIIENPGQPSYQDVSCSFCCTGERCNADLTHMSVYRGT